MPTTLSTPVAPIWPALVTLLLLLIVTATPGAVSPIEPVPVTLISSGALLVAVAVATGVVMVVEMVSVAQAAPGVMTSNGAIDTAARRNVRFIKNGSLSRPIGKSGSGPPNTTAIGRLS